MSDTQIRKKIIANKNKIALTRPWHFLIPANADLQFHSVLFQIIVFVLVKIMILLVLRA